MRVVFMGTPEFAVPSLRAVAHRHNVLSVYTRPDAVSGRGRKRRPSALKTAAAGLGISVRQPASLRSPEEWQVLSTLAPEVVVVAAYGLILPAEVLDIPIHGCVNVHASLLPRWRGAAPIQRAILAGDVRTGVSIMKMEEGLDTGPFCKTVEVEIGDMNSSELTQCLAERGAHALVDALDQIDSGTCEWMRQDESAATYAEKISKEDVALSPDLSVDAALARIRASSPQAPARIAAAGRGITVISADPSSSTLRAGSVACTKDNLLLGFADGALSVLRAKPDGKAEMEGCAWARGSRLPQGAVWSAAR